MARTAFTVRIDLLVIATLKASIATGCCRLKERKHSQGEVNVGGPDGGTRIGELQLSKVNCRRRLFVEARKVAVLVVHPSVPYYLSGSTKFWIRFHVEDRASGVYYTTDPGVGRSGIINRES